jgi:uncharacterized spore protein YtfJ
MGPFTFGFAAGMGEGTITRKDEQGGIGSVGKV